MKIIILVTTLVTFLWLPTVAFSLTPDQLIGLRTEYTPYVGEYYFFSRDGLPVFFRDTNYSKYGETGLLDIKSTVGIPGPLQFKLQEVEVKSLIAYRQTHNFIREPKGFIRESLDIEFSRYLLLDLNDQKVKAGDWCRPDYSNSCLERGADKHFEIVHIKGHSENLEQIRLLVVGSETGVTIHSMRLFSFKQVLDAAGE